MAQPSKKYSIEGIIFCLFGVRLILQRQIIKNPTPTLTLPLKGRGFYGVFSLHGGDFMGFSHFHGSFLIPPLSRGRSGGGWVIHVAVVLIHIAK